MLARVILEKANARDLLALKDSVARLPEINQVLSQFNAEALTRPLDEVHEIHDLLSASIHPAPPISISEGRLIRDGHSSELDQLREISTSGKSYIARLEASERERSGISSLKIRYNKVFGYFIEVTRAHSDRVPEDYVRKQTLVNAERFITAELKDYEEKVWGPRKRSSHLNVACLFRFEVGWRIRCSVSRWSRPGSASLTFFSRSPIQRRLAGTSARCWMTRPHW